MRVKNFFRRISFFLCFLAVFGSVGGHWALAQSVAWARMAIEYSKKSTVSQGVKETLDGKHPCNMCHEIRRGKAKEDAKKQQTALPELKLQAFPISISTFSIGRDPALALRSSFDSNLNRYSSWGIAPPVPPPQVSLT